MAEDFGVLLADAASAVAVADRDMSLHGRLTGSPFDYSIPRATFGVRFGLRRTQNNRWGLILGRESTGKLRRHELRFRMTASSLPRPVTPEPAAGVDFRIQQPPFLASPDERLSLVRRIESAILDPSRRRVLLPESDDDEDDEQKKIRAEAKLIAEERLRLERREAEPQDEGIVIVRLAQPDQHLAIRLSGAKDGQDGIYVLRRTAAGIDELDLYNFHSDSSDRIYFTPLHLVSQTIRRWLRLGSNTSIFENDDLPTASGFGLDAVDSFASDFADAYIRVRQASASAEANHPDGAWYEVDGFTADLSYRIEAGNEGPARFEFSDERTNLLTGQVSFTAREENGRVVLGVKLAAPSFVLSGVPLAEFVAVVQQPENADKVVAAMREQDGQTNYGELLASEENGCEAVVMLNFDKENRPSGEFLVLWPANLDGERREFAFSCRVESGALDDVAGVLPLAQALENRLIPIVVRRFADSSLEEHTYKAFHHFFHAVRIWTVRLRELES